VVSLVPSLTEAIAVTAADLLVGATDWCTHPPELRVTRVRGTKNPDVDRIVGLRPDLVVANFEENREADLDALRAAGVPVWVTVIRTLPEALTGLDRMLTTCGLGRPPWLAEARRAWARLPAAAPGPDPIDDPTDVHTSNPTSEARKGRSNDIGKHAARRRAVVPIWRRPWMVLGRDTFAADLLARLGVDNVYARAAERYPKVSVAQMRAAAPDLVVLPDEPYAFGERDGPEAFAGLPVALVSGRHLEWYGPSLIEAPAVLAAQLAAAAPR
jgi:hypothetical protein